MTTVTAADVRELLTSRASDPILVEWLDEDEAVTDLIEVVAASLFGEIDYSERDRKYRVLARAEDLRQMGDWDVSNPTDEDCEAFAQLINEEPR